MIGTTTKVGILQSLGESLQTCMRHKLACKPPSTAASEVESVPASAAGRKPNGRGAEIKNSLTLDSLQHREFRDENSRLAVHRASNELVEARFCRLLCRYLFPLKPALHDITGDSLSRHQICERYWPDVPPDSTEPNRARASNANITNNLCATVAGSKG